MDRSNTKESLLRGRKGDLKKEVKAEKGEKRTEKGRREEERKKSLAGDMWGREGRRGGGEKREHREKQRWSQRKSKGEEGGGTVDTHCSA